MVCREVLVVDTGRGRVPAWHGFESRRGSKILLYEKVDPVSARVVDDSTRE